MLRWESAQLVLALPVQQSKPQLEFELSETTEPLENDLAITLYRLARESIWNSLRHAEPTSIRVSCSNVADAIELQVIDNGRGFDPRSVRGDARGLIGQRQRVERAGGTFQLETQPGSGTTVTFRIRVFP
jgi:signal transduction histidine kinase